MRHGICRGSKPSGRPGLPAVDRDVHASNSTRPRPSQASDFIESGAGQLLLPGRKSDDRFRPDLAIQSSDTGIGGKMSVIVVGHIVLVHHLDSPQVLNVMNSFIAGHDQPKWEAVLGTHWLAILAVAYQTVVHGLCERKARRAFHGLRSFRH